MINKMDPAKFVLGTANLGMAYGVNNPDNYDLNVAQSILNQAISWGINTFDTATDYGIAEKLIGEAIHPSREYKIITKIPTRESYTYEYVSNCLDQSLMNLKQSKIHGLMFHDPDIHERRNLREITLQLLDSGKIENIGFSAYTLEAIMKAKELNPNWTIFQIPENILDRRLIDSNVLIEMASNGNILYTRSIFLQGLLLCKSSNLPSKFKKYENLLHALELVAKSMAVKPLDLCLSYTSEIAWSSGNIIAAASIAQLEGILNFKQVEVDFRKLETLPEVVLDPRRWSELK